MSGINRRLIEADAALYCSVYNPLAEAMHDRTGIDNRGQALACLLMGRGILWAMPPHFLVVDSIGVLCTLGFCWLIATRPRMPRMVWIIAHLNLRLCMLIATMVFTIMDIGLLALSDNWREIGYTINNLLFLSGVYLADCEDDKPRRRRKREIKAPAQLEPALNG